MTDSKLLHLLRRGVLAGASSLFGVALAGGLLLALGALARPVWAGAITVTTTEDELNEDGDCSLREAIQAANTDAAVDACDAGSGADVITLPAGTFMLTLTGALEDNNKTGDLDITEELTLVGAGSGSTILDGNGTDRVLEVHGAVSLTLSHLAVQNGWVDTQDGGGLLTFGPTTLDNVLFYNNVIVPEGSGGGGGASLWGEATVIDSQFISNAAGYQGGGIYLRITATVTGGLMLNNRAQMGGGAFFQGQADVTGTTFVSNTAANSGGGIYFNGVNLPGAVYASKFVSNVSGYGGGGVVFVYGGLVDSSVFTANVSTFGAGALGTDDEGFAVLVTGTTFYDNRSSDSGGALQAYDAITITNSSFISNTALNGGAARTSGATVLNDTTFLSNTATRGGALYFSGPNSVVTINSGLIASNTANLGGGLYIVTGIGVGPRVTMNGGEISYNQSASDGGGLYIANNSSFTLNGGQIAHNQAGNFGGGLSLSNESHMHMNGGEISYNSAPHNPVTANGGGGVAVRFGSLFTLTNGLIANNTAGSLFNSGGGGGLLSDGALATLLGGEVYGNSGAMQGGGINVVNAGVVALGGTVIRDNTAPHGSAVNVASAQAQLTTTVDTAITGSLASAGVVNAAGFDLSVNGAVEVRGGTFYAPPTFVISGAFTQTAGTYHQTRVVNGNGPVGFPQAGGLLLDARGLGDLGSTEVTIQAGAQCTDTSGEVITHCYTITPTVSANVSPTVTFYFNDADLGANHDCATLIVFQWDGALHGPQTLDTTYDGDGRACSAEPYSVRAGPIEVFGKFVLLSPELIRIYLPLVVR